MNLEARLHKLEREARWYRLGFFALCLAASAVVGFGFDQQQDTVDEVVAKRIRVVSPSGRTVIELRSTGDEEGMISVRNENPARAFWAQTSSATCRANMQTMGNALHAHRIRKRLSLEEVLKGGLTSENMPDLLAMPICPKGGTYSLSRGTKAYLFRCSIDAHGSFDYGVELGVRRSSSPAKEVHRRIGLEHGKLDGCLPKGGDSETQRILLDVL